MKTLHITGFEQGGLNSDISADLLPVSAMTTVLNGRIVSNRLYSIGGYENKSTATVLFTPAHMRFIKAATGSYWVVAGIGINGAPDDRAVYSFDGTSWVDVSTGTNIYDNLINPNQWTSCLFNGRPIINHPQSYPQTQLTAVSTTDFSEIFWDGATNWRTAGMKCGAMASHKEFLFAMNMTEGASELPYVVRWSDAADPGAMPSTWDETVPTNLAGKVSLPAAGGVCLNGLTLRDSFLVYRESSIHSFDFVGGEFVFNVRSVADTIGAAGRNSICEYLGVHYFVSRDGLFMTDGNSVESVIKDKAKISFLSTVNQESIANSFVFSLPILNEIWFCLPIGAAYPNLAYVYNVDNKNITLVDLQESYHMASGYPASTTPTWASATSTWDEAYGSWLVSSSGSGIPSVYYCTIQSGSTLASLNSLNIIGFGSDISVTAKFERVSLLLEEGDFSFTLLEAFPHFSSPADVYLKIGTQESPFGAVTWHPEVTITPGQRKVDLRATGKYFCYSIRSDAKYTWYMSGMTLKYVVDGER